MPSQKNYRLDIQGLRAIAVLAVFLFHLEPRVVSGGFVGVDVFFVISGYLISGIILHKKSQQTFGFLDFYVGRFKRLLPVYLCFLIVTLVVSAFVYLSLYYDQRHLNMYGTDELQKDFGESVYQQLNQAIRLHKKK